jgi:hypothetical protein
MARYSAVIGAPDATLYRGVVCTQCHSVICLDCQDPADQPCKACGGKVLPATGDVIPSTTTTSYLYLLQKSRQPTEALMRTVLKWWRQQHGQNFQMLGGRQVDSIPATADVYVVTTMMLMCEQHGFVKQPDKMGYKTITVDGETPAGETIGVCCFLDQPPTKAANLIPETASPARPDHKGPWCRNCGAVYPSNDVLPRKTASYDDQVRTTYCPACGSEKVY